MDRLSERQLTPDDIRKMNTRAFVVGRLSAGPTSFGDVAEAAETHLKIATGAANAAIWDLANAGIIDGVLDKKMSLATHKDPGGNPDLLLDQGE